MSTLTLIGLGLITFSIGSLLITTSRFTKVRYLGGVTVIKDKKTGQEYVQSKNGFWIKL